MGNSASFRDLPKLLEWPVDPTDKHKAASDTCLAAMEGAAAEPSWIAFMEVAIEAGIFVE